MLGLTLFGVASIALALADSTLTLGLARATQGASSALSWAGVLAWVAVETPRDRRGQALGTVFGAAVFGFVSGPVIGAAAHTISLTSTFVVIAAIAFLLAVVTCTYPRARREQRAPGAVHRALSDPRFLVGVWLNALPAFFFGTLDVLSTLALHAGGYGIAAIGLVFVVAGLAEVAFNPMVGRISDRYGRFVPIRYALLAATIVTVGLAFATEPLVVALLVIAASLSWGGCFAPGMAIVADRAEAALLPQGIGFGVTNTAWALGAAIGPALGGALAQTFDDAVPYLLSAALCVVTLVAITRGRRLLAPA